MSDATTAPIAVPVLFVTEPIVLPGMVVPCGFDGAGLPVGAQMIAPAFGEQRLFDAACAYQARTAFHRARPKED